MATAALRHLAKPVVKYAAKNKLVREFGEEFVEKLAEHTDDFAGVKKGVRKLQKLGVSDDILREVGERFGTDGYGWLLKKRPLGLDNDILRKLTQADNFMDYSDELLDAVRNSDGHADDIIKAVSTYGDDAADAIVKYGDDAADIIAKHGEDGLSWIKKYEKDALDVIGEYGDEALDSLKKGMTPDEVRLDKGILSSEKIKEIVNTPKGSRPDPTTYLSKEYIDAHLAQFDDGISVIQTEWAYGRYTEINGFVGVPDDNTLFVMPKDYCDGVIGRANGNMSIIEMELGFPEGYFKNGGGLVRIDVDDISGLNIRIPSGNEMTANELWIPGGYTSGGVPEAITDIIPIAKTSITRINVD